MRHLQRNPLAGTVLKKYGKDRLLWSEQSDSWQAETAWHTARVDTGGVLTAQGEQSGLSLTPVALRWGRGKLRAFSVGGKTRVSDKNERKQVCFDNVFGPGLHLEYDFGAKFVKKDVIIDSYKALGNPGKAQLLEVVFEIEADQPLIVNGQDWDGAACETEEEIKVGRWTIERPVAASEGSQINPVLRLWGDGEKRYIAKLLSVDWLSKQESSIRTDLTITLDGATTFESGIIPNASDYQFSIAPLDANKFVIAYIGPGNDCMVIVGTVSGSIITITEDGAITAFAGTSYYTSVAALDSTHFVVAYHDASGTAGGHVRAGSVSGTTITLGSEVDFEQGEARNPAIAALDSTHFIIAYYDYDDSEYGKVIAGAVSGLDVSINLSDVKTFKAFAVSKISVAALDSTSFVIAYWYRDSSDIVAAIIGTLSGTTITIAETDEAIISYGKYTLGVAGLDSSHFVVVCRAFSDAYVYAASVSGTSITGGTGVKFSTSTAYYASVTALSFDKFVIAFSDADDSGKGKAILGSVSGTTITITLNGGTTFESGDTRQIVIAGMDESRFVIAFRDNDDSSKGKVITGANPVPPTVTTQAATNIASNSATGNGNITYNGGASITQHGVCWKKGADPVNIASADGHTSEGAGSEGAFSSGMSGLTTHETYYYRAYATNSVGTSYGAPMSFQTLWYATWVKQESMSLSGTGGVKSATRKVNEAIGMSDDVARVGSRAISEGLDVNDLLQRAGTFVKPEQFSLSDGDYSIGERGFAEIIGIGSLIHRAWTAERSFSDAFALSDLFVSAGERSFEESIAIQAVVSFTGLWVLLESLSMSDNISRSGTVLRKESISLTDEHYASGVRVIADSLVMLADAYMTGERAFDEAISVGDGLAPIVAACVYPELISISDGDVSSGVRTFIESFGLSDAVKRQAERAITEILSVDDAEFISALRAIQESLVLSDDLKRTKICKEILTVADSLYRQWQSTRVDSETISMNDRYGIKGAGEEPYDCKMRLEQLKTMLENEVI